MIQTIVPTQYVYNVYFSYIKIELSEPPSKNVCLNGGQFEKVSF